MADKTIGQLTPASSVGSSDLFVLEQAGVAKKLTAQILENWLVSYADGHGGIQSISKTGSAGTNPVVDTYTITYADTTTSTFTVTNGVKGEDGVQTYVWIKWASAQPTQDSDMGDIPDKFIGIYSGTASTAPTAYTSYTWYEYKGAKGDTGDPATITSATIMYQQGDSGNTAPSGTWYDNVPEIEQGKFLWTRIQITFNTGSPITAYSVTRYGIDGNGTVQTVNGIAPDGNGNVQLLTDKYLFLTDSYGTGSGGGVSTTPFCDIVADKLGLTLNTSYFKVARGGAAFGYNNGTASDPDTGVNFCDLANYAIANLTSDQKNEITHIVICGGINDWNYSNTYISTGVSNCKNLLKANFPNADIKFACVGSSIVPNIRFTYYGYKIEAIKSACGTNGITFGQCFYGLLLDKTNMLTDGNHPNQNGQNMLANSVYQYLTGGNNYPDFGWEAISTPFGSATVLFCGDKWVVYFGGAQQQMNFVTLSGTWTDYGAITSNRIVGTTSDYLSQISVICSIQISTTGEWTSCVPINIQFRKESNGETHLWARQIYIFDGANFKTFSNVRNIITGVTPGFIQVCRG